MSEKPLNYSCKDWWHSGSSCEKNPIGNWSAVFVAKWVILRPISGRNWVGRSSSPLWSSKHRLHRVYLIPPLIHFLSESQMLIPLAIQAVVLQSDWKELNYVPLRKKNTARESSRKPTSSTWMIYRHGSEPFSLEEPDVCTNKRCHNEGADV